MFPLELQSALLFALRLCVGGAPVVRQLLLQPFLQQTPLRGDVQRLQFQVQVFRHVFLDLRYAAIIGLFQKIIDEDGGGLRGVVTGEELEEVLVDFARGVHDVKDPPLQCERAVSPVDVRSGGC